MMTYQGAEKGKIRAEDVVEDEQLTFDEAGAGVTPEEVDAVNEAHHDAGPVRGQKGGIVRGFLSPLALFLPTVVVTSNGRKRNDWSLTLLAAALFGYMLSTVRIVLALVDVDCLSRFSPPRRVCSKLNTYTPCMCMDGAPSN